MYFFVFFATNLIYDVNPLRTNFKILYGGMGQIRHIPTCLVLRGLTSGVILGSPFGRVEPKITPPIYVSTMYL